MKFYKCQHCANMITFVKNAGIPVSCCGDKMVEVIPGSTDAAQEKHVPVIEVRGNEVSVKIGSVTHPMVEEHYIEWIAIETTSGAQYKKLSPGEAPEAVFLLADGDSVLAAYEYCNLHGLWKKDCE